MAARKRRNKHQSLATRLTAGSDGPLRYGCTLPQHHPHHRPEYTSYGMPSSLILNGKRLPIGTSDLNGDTSEEEEFGPPQPPQWSDADYGTSALLASS